LIKASEIIAWLEEHKEVQEYLVLDDLALHNDDISAHQIMIDSKVGLTAEDIGRAILILSGA
jgi:hypothetical protein